MLNGCNTDNLCACGPTCWHSMLLEVCPSGVILNVLVNLSTWYICYVITVPRQCLHLEMVVIHTHLSTRK